VVPLLALAIAGVPPFNGLLFEYDPGWLEMTKLANSAVFIGQWERADVVAAVVSLAVAWAAHAGSATPLARACRASVIGAVALCALSYLGADVMHDLLLTQLQLWRALWVVNLLAMFSLPGWLSRLWTQGPSGRLAACAVLVAVVTADSWIPTGWALALWAAMALLLHHRSVPLKPSIIRLAMIATLGAGVMLCLLQAWNAHSQMAMHVQGMAISRPISIPFTLPLLTLPLAFGMFAAWSHGGARRAAALVGAAAILGLGLSQWDQRTPWTRYVESAVRGTHPFDALIPAGAQVYWHGDLAATWFLLGRPEFIGEGQLSGVLFSRETAVAASHRTPLLRAVMESDQACSTLEWFGAKGSELQECRLRALPFFAMCTASPDHADFLVSSTDFGAGVVARWTFAPEGAPPVTYALYDCRRTAAAVSSSGAN
jgi:hypothetical protein